MSMKRTTKFSKLRRYEVTKQNRSYYHSMKSSVSATIKQREYMAVLGITFNNDTTKNQATELISNALRKKS